MIPAFFLALLTMVSIAEYQPDLPVGGVSMRLAVLLLNVGLSIAVAGLLARRAARRLRQDILASPRRRAGAWQTAYWIAATVWLGATVQLVAWPRVIRFDWNLDCAFLLDELLLLLPVMVNFLAAWLLFHEVDRLGRRILAEKTPGLPPLPSRRRCLLLQVRITAGMILIPMLVLFSLNDLVRLFPKLEAAPWKPLIFLVPIGLLFLFFPVYLRWIWGTDLLPTGPLRRRLESISERARVFVADIFVWKTDRMVVNAAVAGTLGRLRYVFLTDGLLSCLSHDDVEAVFAHEIGHIRYRHTLLRLFALICPLAVLTALSLWFPEAWRDWAGCLTGWGVSSELRQAAFSAIAVLYGFLVLGWYSRRLELQADLWAATVGLAEPLRLEDTSPPRLDRYVAALENLVRQNGPAADRGGWLHPSLGQRTRFLRRVAPRPVSIAAFESKMRQIAWLFVGGAGIAGVAILFRFFLN